MDCVLPLFFLNLSFDHSFAQTSSAKNLCLVYFSFIERAESQFKKKKKGYKYLLREIIICWQKLKVTCRLSNIWHVFFCWVGNKATADGGELKELLKYTWKDSWREMFQRVTCGWMRVHLIFNASFGGGKGWKLRIYFTEDCSWYFKERNINDSTDWKNKSKASERRCWISCRHYCGSL